jgi:hypothetical protein
VVCGWGGGTEPLVKGERGEGRGGEGRGKEDSERGSRFTNQRKQLVGCVYIIIIHHSIIVTC